MGSGSCWASRVHQIIGRAAPCEAVCRGKGIRRKTHNFSRWFVWWINSMPIETVSRASWKYKNSGRLEEEQMCVYLCAIVCLHTPWLTYNKPMVERSNVDWQHIRSLLHNIGFYPYFLTIPGVRKSKAVEQPCREEKTKYVTIITKHYILGFWQQNKQAHWAKESVDNRVKRISSQSFSRSIPQYGSEETD